MHLRAVRERPYLSSMTTNAGAPPAIERCIRCAAPMEWRHQTWQCPRCRFKLGCCEGDACDELARYEQTG